MILPKSQDALHRGQLYRLLIAMADNSLLAKSLVFKGGTCAALMNKLDRFSVDLDFDVIKEADTKELKHRLEKVFSGLRLEIKDRSKNAIKLNAVGTPFGADTFEPIFLADIEKIIL